MNPRACWILTVIAIIVSGCGSEGMGVIAPTATVSATNTSGPTTPFGSTESSTATDTATATETPVPTETFVPMEISTNPDKPTKCTYEDMTSGRLAWNEKQQAKPFPEGTLNAGWAGETNSSNSDLLLKSGSGPVEQENPFICETTGDFLGFPNKKLYIIGLPVLNTDNTTGIIHFLVDAKNLKFVLTVLQKSNGTGIAIVRYHPESIVKRYWNDPTYGYAARLYRTEGEINVTKATMDLEGTGVTTAEMERMLFTPSAPGY